MTKKSYNPFKMWGSYVGFVIGLLIAFLPMIFCLSPQGGGCSPVDNIYSLTNFLEGINHLFTGVYYIIVPILGFLLGWGIHLLIRSLNK